VSDPVARRLAAVALAVSLLALVLSAWGTWRSEEELRGLRRGVERAVEAQRGVQLGPRPAFDTEE
jgi:hypothetical protein